MASGILDFIRRRKLYVLVALVIVLVTLVYLRSVPLRRKHPDDSDTGERSLSEAVGGTLIGLRTSVKPELPKGHQFPPQMDDSSRKSGANELNSAQLNRGNLVKVLEKNRPSKEDEQVEREEIKSVEGGEKVEPVGKGGDKDRKVEGTELKSKLEEKAEAKLDQDAKVVNSDHRQRTPHHGGPVEPDKLASVKSHMNSSLPVSSKSQTSSSLHNGIQSQTDDGLYVHSSMPLGPALKIPHTEKQRAVVDAFKHAWSAYKKYAWGEDDLLPLSKSHSSVDFGMAMTLVDSLDTMWLMGLQEEFDEARKWVADNLKFDNNFHKVIVFETNIRVLGGLLSAYHLSQDEIFLQKAILLGDRLLPAFGTPSGLPVNRIDLQRGLSDLKKSHHPNYGSVNIAEAGSLQLEFRDLSRASGDHKYQEAVDRDLDVILKSSSSGLYPQYLSVSNGYGSSSTYTVGAGADSFYEYLLKQWLQTNKKETKFLDKYLKSAEAVKNNLVGYTKPSSLPYLGVKTGGGYLHNTMEHLACFYPGLLALGLLNDQHPQQLTLAKGLTHSCYLAYNSTPSGLAPDSFMFNTDSNGKKDFSRASEAKNIQRPETVESLFVMYRFTKDEMYRNWGWKIFKAFDTNMRVEGGFSSLRDVMRVPSPRSDKMESFFLAETLKYLFLLFGDNDSIVSLDEWVFNTEAHPLPIWDSQR